MIYQEFEDDTYRCVVFDQSNTEWERVRNLCLEENNWLRENYTEKNCVVEDHDIFSITYVKETNNPICFCGIYNNGRYHKKVARAFNRFYLFPEYRSSKLIRRMKAMHDLILPSMILSNPVSRDLLFISMQMRDRDYQGEQRWWNAWKKIWMSFSQDWKDIEGLVQVVGGEDPKCFQNIVYREYDHFTYSDWNPKTTSFDQQL
jgi:hypothetical protein